MTDAKTKIDVYLETGSKRTFAGALDWPGWCRSGRDEESALQALFDYAPRYARVLCASRLGLQVPKNVSEFGLVERLRGDATTDFGSPGAWPKRDALPVDDADLARFKKILRACWRAFDAAVASAQGKELLKGPRGGGRETFEIVRHVVDADKGYLARIGCKYEGVSQGNAADELDVVRQSVIDALEASAHGETPTHGPRGGVMWSPRYFVRRVAWHVLDHAWEVEDRVI